jgi:hypothetical protein
VNDVFAGGGGINFHVQSTYAPHGYNQQVSQVLWKSANDGVSFTGTYIAGTTRNIGPISGCEAGDYQGAAFDNHNNKVFFDWMQIQTTTAVIAAATLNP